MISVVIPTYNRKDELPLLLDALDKEVFPRDKFEVIVVDDGSTDGTKEFLKSYSPLYNITTIFHRENLGSAVSRNDGIKAAKKEIILLLDDDLIPEQGILRHHADNHRNGACAVIGNITYRETFTTRWISRYLSTRGVKKIPKGERIPFKCFWSSNASVKKKHLLQVGLFDEEFKVAGGEDTELAYRLEKAGISFVYEEKAICYHQPVSLQELMERQRSFAKNALPLLLRKGTVFKEVFKIDYAKKPAMRMGLLLPVYFCAYGISNILKFVWLHSAIIDYLIYSNRMRANS
jgi:glycosyltransferase involved in cell wall biosynthesis